MSNIKIACSLFSFGTPYIQGHMSLEDCIRKAAEIGCEGYEIVAAQMIASYPYVTDEVAGEFAVIRTSTALSPFVMPLTWIGDC